jgi:hypothetical protein
MKMLMRSQTVPLPNNVIGSRHIDFAIWSSFDEIEALAKKHLEAREELAFWEALRLRTGSAEVIEVASHQYCSVSAVFIQDDTARDEAKYFHTVDAKRALALRDTSRLKGDFFRCPKIERLAYIVYASL